jgi:hypothetical protein
LGYVPFFKLDGEAQGKRTRNFTPWDEKRVEGIAGTNYVLAIRFALFVSALKTFAGFIKWRRVKDMPEFLALTDTQHTTCQRLASDSQRIGRLLAKHKDSRTGLLACLDDLLGAVYNLFYAAHYGYSDRQNPLSEHDIGNVVVRANDMAQCKVRIEGKWTAGVFFNNALFRLAGIYHRTLKIAAGRPTTREYPVTLLPDVEKAFKGKMNTDWNHPDLAAIYKEVTELKHSAGGIFEGRSVQFGQAIHAVDQVLTLIETLCWVEPLP